MKKNKKIDGTIYKVVSPSGKIYIGQTARRFSKRKSDHINKANNLNSKEYNNKFANAIRKYGNKLKWEILIKHISTYDELNDIETKLIKKYDSMKNGYNSTAGGKNGPLPPSVIKKLSGKNNHNFGKHFSKKTREKISKSKMNPSQEIREKISAGAVNRYKTSKHPWIGRHHSENTKKKLSKKTTEYAKNNPQEMKKRSNQAKKRFSDPKNREKLSIVKGGKLFDVFEKHTGKYIGTWINKNECAKKLKTSHQTIGKCLNGKYKSTKGYIFRYCK